jgi:hypothetical protein
MALDSLFQLQIQLLARGAGSMVKSSRHSYTRAMKHDQNRRALSKAYDETRDGMRKTGNERQMTTWARRPKTTYDPRGKETKKKLNVNKAINAGVSVCERF